MKGKKQLQFDFGAPPPRLKKRQTRRQVTLLDLRRHWVFAPPSDAEVAAVESMERDKRAGSGE